MSGTKKDGSLKDWALKEIAQGVADADAKQVETMHAKFLEQAFYLNSLVSDVRAALPALQGVELIPGKTETVLTADGLAADGYRLVQKYSLRTLVDALVEVLEKQHQGRTAAAARAAGEADRIRKRLKLHKALLKLAPREFESALDRMWQALR